MEGYPESDVTGEALAAQWGTHIAAHQAPGVEWDPKTGYTAEQLRKAAQSAGEGLEVYEGDETGAPELGPGARDLSPEEIANLGKPVVHSAQEQPKGDDGPTTVVPGGIINSH